MLDNEYNEMVAEMGAQSEALNCYDEASMVCHRLDWEGKARVQPHLDAGKFVVVRDVPYYCKATDALVGSYRCLDSVHDSREAANAAAEASYCDWDDAPPYVLPREVREVVAAPVADDCPF